MKYLLIGTVIPLLYMLLLVGCRNEEVESRTPQNIDLRFSIVTAEEGVVNTRAGEDADAVLNNVYVLIFDGNTDDAHLIDWAMATSAGGSAYYATLKESTVAGTMYVFGNIESVLSGSVDFPENTTLAQIKSLLQIQLLTQNSLIVQDPRFAPMIGGPQIYDKDGETLSFSLVRSTAKVTVKNLSGNPSYVMQGANLGNAPVRGYVFGGMPAVTDKANYAGNVSGEDYSVESMMRGVVSGIPTETEPLYMFESTVQNGKGAFVIIRGEYNGVTGYHRLDIKDQDGNPLEVTRNYQYVIKINKIQTGGYRTADEAIKNAASNRDVNWSVDVVDPSSHDIISNGEQYLGVSNSRLILYKSGDLRNVDATTLSFTFRGGWLPGTVTAFGDNLTLSDASGNGVSLALPAEDTKEKPIRINCGSAFTSGYLVIHVGDLSKIVTITRNSNLSAVPDEIKFDGQAIGDCSESGSMKTFIRFADKSGAYSPESDRDIYSSETGEVYALVMANTGYGTRVTERDGEFYVAEAQDGGRTKVVFHQEKLDVYNDLVQLKPYTYVGTFHRWNQTAERIIRIKTEESDPNFRWTAVVVAGQDFIMLDTNRSPDRGITTYAYGCDNPVNPVIQDHANWTSDQDIEAYCQITDGKLLVTGQGNKVYFRVGMRSQLPGGEHGQPRYGLIALIHRGGTHLIYVRQGEEADYLMRPNDPVSTPALSMSSRPEAVKISPYNVTLPDNLKSSKYYDLADHEGVWTDYPSQGGFFFQGTGRRAYCPIGVDYKEIGWLDKYNTSGSYELCPAGFRRPNDGAYFSLATVVGSELRQSFWLNPLDGREKSSFDNMLRGYIADGYFDRRVVRFPDKQKNEGYPLTQISDAYSKIPTLVADGAYTGYAGMLLYNPITYASIFIPATGSRSSNSGYGAGHPGDLVDTGLQSNLWTSTLSATSYGQGWYLATGYYYRVTTASYGYVLDNYSSSTFDNGFSIRGVKK